jgi:hypothetical protein
MPKVYIDENMPHQLAEALNILQQPLNFKESIQIEVCSIKKVFGQGAKDEDWIPLVGKEGGIIITQDYNIQTTRHQRDLCEANGLGMLYIKPPAKNGLSYWQMAQFIVTRWEEIKKIISKNKPPFAFRSTVKSKKFEKID